MYRYTPELRELFSRPLPVQLSCTVAVALTDLTHANGAPTIYPRSHRWQETPQQVAQQEKFQYGNVADPRNPAALVKWRKWAKKNKGVEPIQATAKAGSVLVWTGGTWHGAGSWSEDAAGDRTAVILNCARGVLRTQTSQGVYGLAAMPFSLTRQMSMNLKRLLGCFPAGHGLGGSQQLQLRAHDNLRQLLEAEVGRKKFADLLQNPSAIAAIAAVLEKQM